MTQPPGGWLRRSSRETEGAVWLALLAGLLLLLPNSPPRPLAVLYALLMTAVLALAKFLPWSAPGQSPWETARKAPMPRGVPSPVGPS